MTETIAALTAAVKACPANAVLPLVLADALDESGTPENAAQALALRIQAEVDAKRATKLRTLIRDEVGLGRHGRAPITVVAGAAAPTKSGRSWYYTTESGRQVRHPLAYKKIAKSAVLVYHGSSYAVTVGAEWVAARM